MGHGFLLAIMMLQTVPAAVPQCIHLRIERPGLKLLDVGTAEGRRAAAVQFNTREGLRIYVLDLKIQQDGSVVTVVRDGMEADSRALDEFALRAGDAPRNTPPTPSLGLYLVGIYLGKPYGSSCGLTLRSAP